MQEFENENAINATMEATAKQAADEVTKSAKETAEKLSKGIEVITVDDEESADEVENVIKLSKSYQFEGEIINKIDLSGIETMNAMTMQKIDRLYRKIAKSPVASPELTLDYAIAAAHVLTNLPLEFLKRISGKDIIKIKSRVINFLYSED